jgi:LacI family transcriptional regulator
MSATINDVAREAGVSITTVSRVVNNNYPVKKETREKIENAIEKLNYKPNAMARSLITKRTSMIGIIVPGITNLFFPTIVEAIEEVTKREGYNISLCNTGGDYKEEKEVVSDIISRQMDGIIVIDPRFENIQSGFYDSICKTIPTVVVNGAPAGLKCSFVSYDEEVGTYEAFEYLLSLGHKKIAFVRGNKSFSYDIKEKIYKNILEKNRFNYQKVVDAGKGNRIEVVERTQTVFERILLEEEHPTAVFACNDLMALGVINACSKLNIKVPEELSVIGFDNTMLADISHPKLTSVDLNMKEIGYRAAAELLNEISNGDKGRRKIIMDTKLIIRESCGKATDIIVKL